MPGFIATEPEAIGFNKSLVLVHRLTSLQRQTFSRRTLGQLRIPSMARMLSNPPMAGLSLPRQDRPGRAHFATVMIKHRSV